jgi:hypothetical protein
LSNNASNKSDTNDQNSAHEEQKENSLIVSDLKTDSNEPEKKMMRSKSQLELEIEKLDEELKSLIKQREILAQKNQEYEATINKETSLSTAFRE